WRIAPGVTRRQAPVQPIARLFLLLGFGLRRLFALGRLLRFFLSGHGIIHPFLSAVAEFVWNSKLLIPARSKRTFLHTVNYIFCFGANSAISFFATIDFRAREIFTARPSRNRTVTAL